MIRIAGAGDNHHALLQIPPQNHLGRGYPVGLCNARDHAVPQQFRRVAPVAKGIPALHHNTEFLDRAFFRPAGKTGALSRRPGTVLSSSMRGGLDLPRCFSTMAMPCSRCFHRGVLLMGTSYPGPGTEFPDSAGTDCRSRQ